MTFPGTNFPSASYSSDIYPFAGNIRTVNGFRMHVLDEGEGETVVMLHGNPTWSFFYRNLVLGLRDRYRVIVPDHIGCGLSDKPDEQHYDYSLQRRVDDLAAMIEQADIRGRITLVMHDWGGMIGMAYATRHPERIARLVILNTAAFHLPKTKKLPTSLWLCRKTPLGALIIRDTAFFVSVLAHWGVCHPMAQAVREGYLLPYRTPQDRTGVLRFVKDIPLRAKDPGYQLVSDTQEKLGLFANTPTLILWGDKDFVFDHHFLREWRTFLPGAEVHQFADAGHYVLEDAGPRILPLISDFLGRHPVNV
ncbi:MAG: alpha/beta fold hydrolase [Burkholderiales bacterium]